MFFHEMLTLIPDTLQGPKWASGLGKQVDLRLWHEVRWEKSGGGSYIVSQAWTTMRSMNLNEDIPSPFTEPSCMIQASCLIGLDPHYAAYPQTLCALYGPRSGRKWPEFPARSDMTMERWLSRAPVFC